MRLFYKSFQRLRTKPEFDNVFTARNKINSKYFLLFHCPNNQDHPRFGIILSKRKIRHAVARNRVRRLAKETFRLQQHILPTKDLVILPKFDLTAVQSVEISQCLAKLFEKLPKG